MHRLWNNLLIQEGKDIGGQKRIFNGTVDMGAYEHSPVVVVMCWTDESSAYTTNKNWYEADLAFFRQAISEFAAVKTGCLIPYTSYSGAPNMNSMIYQYNPPQDPPSEIYFHYCSEAPNWDKPDMYHMIDDFDNIRNGMQPDYIILVTDRSGSLSLDPYLYPESIDYIEPGYSSFRSWLGSQYLDLYASGRIIETSFTNPPNENIEDWLRVITDALNGI